MYTCVHKSSTTEPYLMGLSFTHNLTYHNVPLPHKLLA